MKKSVPEVPAKETPVPPPKGFRAVLRHLRSWLEAYVWLPIALLSIIFAAKFSYFLTGRRPTESADVIVEIAFRLVAAVLVIFLVSVTRQQTGTWWTRDELLANPKLAGIQAAVKCFFAGLFAYILTH